MSLPCFSGDNAGEIIENIVMCEEVETTEYHKEVQLADCPPDTMSCSGQTLDGEDNISCVDTVVPGSFPFSCLKWSREAAACLLKYIKEYQTQLNNKKLRKATVWEAIAKQITESGFQFNGSQCDQKWRNIIKRYKKYLRDLAMGRKRNNPNQIDFFEELQELLGDKFIQEENNSTEFDDDDEQDQSNDSILFVPCEEGEVEDETLTNSRDEDAEIIVQATAKSCDSDKSNKLISVDKVNSIIDVIKTSVENQTQAIYALIENNKRQSQVMIEMLRKQNQEDLKWKRQILEVLDRESKQKENSKKRKIN